MKRVLLLVISSLLLCSTITIAQPIIGSGLNSFIQNKNHKNGLKNAFAQRYCIYNQYNKEYISLIMKVSNKSNLKFLNKYDCFIGSHVGQIITLRVNVNDISKLVKEKDIIEIESSRKIDGQLLKNAPYDMGINNIYQGLELLKPYTGKDVIIGIADWGADYTHPTFYDTLFNEYRILAAWDQFRKQGPAPQGFSYGTLLEGEANLLAAGTDTANIYDTGAHATHVGGICAGSGAGTAYRGIAFESNILYCNWIVDEASYMDGCSWMRDYAKNLGKRLVINNSWGVYSFGYMDGTSLLDEFINTMSSQDSVIFVVSAGNNGDCNFHIKADFNNSNSDTLRSLVKFNFPIPYSKNYWGETLTLQSENNAEFKSKLEFYDYAWNKIGETPILDCDGSLVSENLFLTESGDSIIYRASSRFPNDHRPLVDWEVRHSKYTNNSDNIVLCIIADSGIVHAWNLACLTTGVGNWGLNFEAAKEGYLKGDTMYGVSEPALAKEAISVAAHKYRKNGSWKPTLASFSSRGHNMTSYYKPEISAPGVSIISAYSSFASKKNDSKITVEFNNKTYQFADMSGTSMAAPMVSGSVALMLQANKNLSSQDVKDIIISTAKTDDYTGICPNNSWGYGKINTYQAVQQAERKIGLNEIIDNEIHIYPIPAKNNLYIEGLPNNYEIEIIDIVGRVVFKGKIKGENININNLSGGVYLLNIIDKEISHKIKFIKK